MEIHLHLSRQFRALDNKWGTPVDLDTTANEATARSHVQLDTPADTFSSEKYLRAIKRNRPTPYSRGSSDRRMGKIKQVSKPQEAAKPTSSGLVAKNSTLQDSAVSLSESATLREDGLLKAMRGLVEEMEAPLELSYIFDEENPGEIEKIAQEKRQFESVFTQLKNAAFSYIKKKYTRS